MRSTTVLFTLVASAVAFDIQPRQTDSAATATSGCLEAALSLAEVIPTPPPALASDLGDIIQLTGDPCQLSIPASLSSDFSSYSSQLESWYSANSNQIQSIETECAALIGTASYALPVCTTGLTAVGGSGSGPSSVSGAVSATGAKTTATSTSTISKANAAPRETGMVFAAVAAAGLAAMVL